MARPPRNQAHETVVRRLGRDADSTIVSLARDDGTRFTRVGRGASHVQRYADALAQIPPGEYVVAAVSTPGTVYSDVLGRDEMLSDRPSRKHTPPMNRYEGKKVIVS